ncbi:cache domain-containing protein [Desulfospira joergensenii]|uniref:cache domain-containing protein n=1 Tax=Desulfospira joergensenii TaxID=53329 RepID=UPI0003B3745A|nr:cache domain-containing protein [Desulfospira joergensenii]
MRCLIAGLVCLGLVFGSAGWGGAEEKATPAEVYEMVLKAAAVVGQLGQGGLDALSNTKEFVWKDSYVWATNCDKKILVAHPNKKLIGLDLTKVYDKNPDASKRKLHNLEMCKGASNPNGVWVEYWWEKLGETQPSRKISFMVQVPGQPYQVTAGIYDDTTTIEELNKGFQ